MVCLLPVSACCGLQFALALILASMGVQAQEQGRDLVFTNAIYDRHTNTYEYMVTINQNDLVNQTIETVQCANTRDSRPVMYSLYYLPGSTQYFSIGQTTGDIKLMVDGLAFENDVTYSAQIQCSQSDDTPLDASLRVRYQIQNEYTPTIIPSTLIQLSFSEDYDISGENSVIFDFSATDSDRGACGLITYSIGSKNRDLFHIDPTSGVLTFLRPLDYESRKQHTVVILAENKAALCSSPASPRAQNAVQIRVNDTNDTPPRFDHNTYNVSIQEHAKTPLPYIIVSVSCFDPDTTSHLVYTLHNSNAPFIINNRGNISITEELDYETKPSYTLTVSCEDIRGERYQIDNATINVTVLPLNEHRPSVMPSLITFTINTSTPEGTVLVSPLPNSTARETYTVRDLDRGSNHGQFNFTIMMHPEEYGEHFSLDHETGELSLLNRFQQTQCGQDDPLIAKITMSITVCDISDVSMCNILTVHLFVLNRNCTAHFDQPTKNVSVNETTLIRTNILSLVCRDFSNVTKKTIILLPSPKDSLTDAEQVFTFDQDSDSLILLQSLDYEARKIYTLHLMCSNSYNTTATTQVVVNVLPENDNRPFFDRSLYFINVTDDKRDIPRQIGQIQATDRDEDVGAHLEYSSVNPSQYFMVQPDGQVFLLKSLPESETVFTLAVTASDGKFSSNTTIIIIQEPTLSEESALTEDSIVLMAVFSTILLFMVVILLLSWIIFCRLLHRQSKKNKLRIGGAYTCTLCSGGSNITPNYCHYDGAISNQTTECLAYNAASFVNDPAFSSCRAKDPLPEEPEYETLVCKSQDSLKNAGTEQPYTLPKTRMCHTKAAPQNSIDCYVRMESASETPLSPQEDSGEKEREALVGDNGERKSFSESVSQPHPKVTLSDTKFESSLEFGGSIETSLEFGGTRETSLDFSGANQLCKDSTSPRRARSGNFRMDVEGGRVLEVCQEFQENEATLNSADLKT